MTAQVSGRPSMFVASKIARRRGMSTVASWSCRVFVPVETTTLRPESSAGTR